MLPPAYKFSIQNESNVTLGAGDVDISVTPFKFTSAGVLSYSSPVTRTTAGTVADGARSDIGAGISNTTELALGAIVEIEVTTPGSGTVQDYVEIWLHRSEDGSNYDDNALAELIAVIPVAAISTLYRKVVEI